MHCEGKLKLKSHNTSYCLIEVVTKAGLTVHIYIQKKISVKCQYEYLWKKYIKFLSLNIIFDNMVVST
jgi:hypothetical protein